MDGHGVHEFMRQEAQTLNPEIEELTRSTALLRMQDGLGKLDVRFLALRPETVERLLMKQPVRARTGRVHAAHSKLARRRGCHVSASTLYALRDIVATYKLQPVESLACLTHVKRQSEMP